MSWLVSFSSYLSLEGELILWENTFSTSLFLVCWVMIITVSQAQLYV